MLYRKKGFHKTITPFSCGTSDMRRSIGKIVLFETFDVKVQVQNVPEL